MFINNQINASAFRTKGTIIRTDNDAASASVGSNVCLQTKAEERRAKVTMRRNKKTTQVGRDTIQALRHNTVA